MSGGHDNELGEHKKIAPLRLKRHNLAYLVKIAYPEQQDFAEKQDEDSRTRLPHGEQALGCSWSHVELNLG